MALTPQQKLRLIRHLGQKVLSEISDIADVHTAINGLNQGQENHLLNEIRHRHMDNIGRLMMRAVVQNVIKPRAEDELSAMAADNTYSDADIIRLLG